MTYNFSSTLEDCTIIQAMRQRLNTILEEREQKVTEIRRELEDAESLLDVIKNNTTGDNLC